MKLSVADEYSSYPAGRDAADGEWNGERFRRDFLLPRYTEAKQRGVKLIISFDGVKSFGSSFLEEAFGGLVRKERVSRRDLINRLKFELGREGNKRYERAILRYISDAR